MDKKILVCITPQTGSVRLIDKGYEVANEIDGELNILHVEKGQNILNTEESMTLLEKLFVYGSQLGGIVHGVCGEDVYSVIKKFIKKNDITDIILGESPEGAEKGTLNDKIMLEMPYLNIHIL